MLFEQVSVRCAPRCSFVLVAAILVAGTGCYEPPVAWMRADVELDEVTLFHFAATQRTNLTGRELVSFVLSMRGEDRPERWSEVAVSAERMGFTRELDQLIAGYSMGMRKKLALVTALAHDPAVLLLDEPTNGLDPVVAREVRSLLEERAARGVTVVLSTHLLDVAQRVCHRLGVIVKGRLRAVGDAGEVCAQAGGVATLEEAFMALTAAG